MSSKTCQCDYSEPSDEECDCTIERFCSACGRLMQLQPENGRCASACSCACACKATGPRQHRGSCSLWNTNSPPRTTPSMEEKFIQLVEKWSRESHPQAGEKPCSKCPSRTSHCSCKNSPTRVRSCSASRQSVGQMMGLSIPLDEEPCDVACQCAPDPRTLKLWKGITLKFRIGSKGVVGTPEITVKDRPIHDDGHTDLERPHNEHKSDKEGYDSDDEIFYVKKLKHKNRNGERKHSRVSIEDPSFSKYGMGHRITESLMPMGSICPSSERIVPDPAPDPCPPSCTDPVPCPRKKGSFTSHHWEQRDSHTRNKTDTSSQGSSSSHHRGVFKNKSKHSSFSDRPPSIEDDDELIDANDPHYQDGDRVPSHTSNVPGNGHHESERKSSLNSSTMSQKSLEDGARKSSHATSIPDSERKLSHPTSAPGSERKSSLSSGQAKQSQQDSGGKTTNGTSTLPGKHISESDPTSNSHQVSAH